MPTIKRLEKKKPIPYKHDNQYAEYYNSTAWNKLRNYYLTQHSLCENCLSQGKVTPAEEVHHKNIIGSRVDGRWERTLDENNLMSLCKSCHRKMHDMARRQGLGYVDFIKID